MLRSQRCLHNVYLFLQNLISSVKRGEYPVEARINQNNPRLLLTANGKCAEKGSDRLSQLGLVFLVKSRPENSKHRTAIRDTWGLEERFPKIPIRTVFLVGTSESKELVSTWHKK